MTRVCVCVPFQATKTQKRAGLLTLHTNIGFCVPIHNRNHSVRVEQYKVMHAYTRAIPLGNLAFLWLPSSHILHL